MKKLISGKYMRLWLFLVALSRCALAQVVPVSNVEELYSEVNSPSNAGATLVLAPGTYMLSTTDAHGASRPNAGRIEFQPDMTIMGVEGDRSQVVIDASGLPATSFPQTMNGVPSGTNAAVRMGRGHNALEWLTVVNAVHGQANIDAGLSPTDPSGASVVVAHVASTGSTRGLNVTANDSQWVNKTVEADITDNYFFNNAMEGVRTGTLPGAQGATVNVRMSGNLSWGQRIGWVLEHLVNSDSTINALATGNRFYSNAIGLIILGAEGNSNGNTVNLELHGDQITDNNTRTAPRDAGGLIVVAAENAGADFGNNTVNVSLWGCRMLDNSDTDLKAIASRSNPPSVATLSPNNHITIEIHGDGNGNGKWQPVEFFADVVPSGPTYGNSVTVIQ